MLNNKGFDLWADGYDKSVGLSDEDEIYFVYEEIGRAFPAMKFEQVSFCAGVFTLMK